MSGEHRVGLTTYNSTGPIRNPNRYSSGGTPLPPMVYFVSIPPRASFDDNSHTYADMGIWGQAHTHQHIHREPSAKRQAPTTNLNAPVYLTADSNTKSRADAPALLFGRVANKCPWQAAGTLINSYPAHRTTPYACPPSYTNTHGTPSMKREPPINSEPIHTAAPYAPPLPQYNPLHADYSPVCTRSAPTGMANPLD